MSVSENCVDIDGYVYKTVKLRNKLWMAENLKVTRYRNGDEIPLLLNHDEWEVILTGARSMFYHEEENAVRYGYFYNWFAVVDARNIAPEGWRVPTDDDWKKLKMHLGMSQTEADGTGFRCSPIGSKLAGNASLWQSGDLKNHSEFGTSGFSALPADSLSSEMDSPFYGFGVNAYFWSTTEIYDYYAWYRSLLFDNSAMNRNHHDKENGFSVRLIRD